MSNYSKVSLGSFSNIAKEAKGKAFLHDALALSSCELSLSVLPANTKLPFSHSHKENEEVYVFLSGTGSLILDGKKLAYAPGDCFRVAPSCVRSIESVEETNYICIQAKEGSLTSFGLADAIV